MMDTEGIGLPLHIGAHAITTERAKRLAHFTAAAGIMFGHDALLQRCPAASRKAAGRVPGL